MRRNQHGFTLLELMVVVTIIGILAAVAVPVYLGYVQEARLNEAKPYLLDIASKERTYKIRNGVYCCSGDIFDESVTGPGLGVDLNSTGNFCFVVICRDAAICGGTTAKNFIATAEAGDPAIEFEVWAILRGSTGTTLAGPQGASCKMDSAKLTSTGWVAPANSGAAAREGRVVVFRYPPPPNGRDTVTGQDGLRFSWVEGTSVTHALTK
jgi:prepilin-type N-terminal cleavage/methylation domain-containing protein